MKNRVVMIFGLTAAFVSASFAQTTPTAAPMPAIRSGSFAAALLGVPFAVPAVTGQPYSAEQVSSHTQTLSDGTQISEEMPSVKMYRDSAGRTRTERPLTMGPRTKDGPTLIEISDPVAGFRYTLDTANQVVHRMAIPRPGTRPRSDGADAVSGVTVLPLPPPPPAIGAETRGVFAFPGGGGGGSVTRLGNNPEVSSESLGSEVIDGNVADGKRRTFTYPIGSQGNDRPLVRTSETWTSPELKIMLLSKRSNPRKGETVVKLVNLSRAEPDPSLFQPPPDFKVVDEESQFRLEFNRP